MDALSLKTEPPRGPRVQLAGLFFTARAVDKMRASLPGGELNGYLALTGFSEVWSYYTGIDLGELRAVVARSSAEHEVEAWILERTAGIDRITVNRKLEAVDTGRTPESMRELFESLYPQDLRERHPILFDLLEADDRRLYAAPSRVRELPSPESSKPSA